MAEEPDRLRHEIEGTRASLTRDVDLLAEKTSPRQIARRRWTSVREKVMGAPDDTRGGAHSVASSVKDAAGSVKDAAGSVKDTAGSVGDTVGEKAHQAGDAVRNAPHAVAQQTQGNPIAAGIIAFGVGLLAATLIPVTNAEQRAGQQLKDNSGELTDRVKGVAEDVGADLRSSAQDAAAHVKETAQDAAQTTKDQAASSARQTKQAAQS